jgi:Ca2+-binding EF-hand superfamily protein
LHRIKEKEKYFKKSDIEAMYDSFNFFEGRGEFVTYEHLLDGMKSIGISCSKQDFLEKYPQYKLDRHISKLDFIKIIEQYYNKHISVPEEEWTPIPIINKPRPV